MPKVKCPKCQLEYFIKIKQRSLKENNYYWGVVIETLVEQSETGYEPEDWHDILKNKFLMYVNDQGFTRTRSTTSLTTEEFERYLEKIRMWAAQELSVLIPLPKENENRQTNQF